MARRGNRSGELFIEASGQLRLVDKSAEQQALENGKCECLGLTFDSEEAQRAYFTEKLREKLAEAYARDPFAVDTSVGKTDALFKAHSYITKVPYLAIVPSILHYTEPGDIVLDGFAGSGMTGVAAQWCGAAPAEYRKQIEALWAKEGRGKPKWGARRAILNDLGPAATFIAANYTLPFDVQAFAKAAQRILAEVETELGWMYETLHTDGKTKGRISYTVWSEVFTCPSARARSTSSPKRSMRRPSASTRTFPAPTAGQC